MTQSILFWWHLTVVLWRFFNGRWYVFRDRPSWFVANVSTLPFDKDDEELNDLIRLARDEVRLRLRMYRA